MFNQGFYLSNPKQFFFRALLLLGLFPNLFRSAAHSLPEGLVEVAVIPVTHLFRHAHDLHVVIEHLLGTADPLFDDVADQRGTGDLLEDPADVGGAVIKCWATRSKDRSWSRFCSIKWMMDPTMSMCCRLAVPW